MELSELKGEDAYYQGLMYKYGQGVSKDHEKRKIIL
jgi:hypothetical protein